MVSVLKEIFWKMFWQNIEAGERPINVALLWRENHLWLHPDSKNLGLQRVVRKVF